MSKKATSRVQKATLISAVILFIVIVSFFVVLGIGLRNKHWFNDTTVAITKVFPCRAALVGSEPITFNQVHSDSATLVHYYNKMIAETGRGEMPEIDMILEQTTERLIKNKLVEREAAARGISVDENAVQTEIDNLIKEAGSEEEVLKRLEDYYGWDLEDFENKVIRPYLYEMRLAEDFSKDEELLAEVQEAAQEVKAKIDAGEDFTELAKEYSDDPSAVQNGGDLGWFGRGAMVPEFEEAVFSLEVGQVSDVVKSDFGYHIIKLVDRRETEDGEEELNAKHILVSPQSYEEWIAEKMDSDMVIKYIKFEEDSAEEEEGQE